MAEDFTETMRECDSLMEALDEIFVRANDDPAYPDEARLTDAVLDNIRYYNADRKAELVEIFYSILSQIREAILKQNRTVPFCNPQIAGNGTPQLPQVHMLMRSMMPITWAMAERWEVPELRNTRDAYLMLFSDKESGILSKVLNFLFQLFPEEGAGDARDEFLTYWRTLAETPDQLPPEPESAKQLVRDYLLAKRQKHS